MGNWSRGMIIMGCLVTSSRLLQGLSLIPTKNSSLCGDWLNYNNEKCFKMVDKVDPQTKEVADIVCKSIGLEFTDKPLPRLITIKDKEKLRFFQHLFLDNKMATDIWLGLSLNSKTGRLEWNDGSKLVFSNLAKSNMSDSNSQCVAMNTNETGFWQRVNCTNQNGIICERDVTAPLTDLEGFQQDSNQSAVEWNDIKSEKDCKEQIMKSEQNTDFLMDAAEKAIEMLNDARENIVDIKKSKMPIKEISFLTGTSLTTPSRHGLCGDWTNFNDEKCFKIAEKAGAQMQEDAEILCQALGDDSSGGSSSKLITIKSEEEQEFLQRFLFVENKVIDNVWLGLAKKDENEPFQWNDRSELSFSNWVNQEISASQYDCVTMQSGDGGLIKAGLWLAVNCKRKNAVVCERRPTWTLDMLQNTLMNFKLEEKIKRKELEQKLTDSERELNRTKMEWERQHMKSEQDIMKQVDETLQKEINVFKVTSVPIGFVYIQLPDQSSPTTLWPTANWTEVSSSYAGLFFRVVGGEAAPFGQIQVANTSRLEEVDWTGSYDDDPIVVPTDGRWSRFVALSQQGTSSRSGLRFRLSKSEIRPRNQAMKIWKRFA